MKAVSTLNELQAIFGPPSSRALLKEMHKLDRHCIKFIQLSTFLVMATSDGGHSADASPRGGAPGFVRVLDETHLLLPDRPGNNRIDSLKNILTCPTVGVLFMVPGFDETLRVTGTAEILNGQCFSELVHNGLAPKIVLRIEVRQVFFQCAKAIIRAKLWEPTAFVARTEMPTLGEILKEQTHSTAPPESDAAMRKRYEPLL